MEFRINRNRVIGGESVLLPIPTTTILIGSSNIEVCIRSTYDLLQVHTSNMYFKYILQLSIRNKSYILQVPTFNTYFKYILQVGKNFESRHNLQPTNIEIYRVWL